MQTNESRPLDHAAAQRELAAEQLRMRHYQKALACASDDSLRERWHVALEASRKRAAKLTIAVVEMGGELPPLPAEVPDSDRCLMEAMEMALSNGDMPAAEAVALECMRLVDIHCTRMRHHFKATLDLPLHGRDRCPPGSGSTAME